MVLICFSLVFHLLDLILHATTKDPDHNLYSKQFPSVAMLRLSALTGLGRT